MTGYFAQFALTLGAALALVAIIAGWLFRAADVWIVWRMALPAALVALACYVPWTVKAMMGLPVDATMAALPEEAQLIAFFPHDTEQRVDLWLTTGAVPRAYEIPLDKETKKLLQGASDDLAQGKPVFVKKKRKHPSGDGHPGGAGGAPITDLQDDYDPHYELDQSAASTLPPKE